MQSLSRRHLQVRLSPRLGLGTTVEMQLGKVVEVGLELGRAVLLDGPRLKLKLPDVQKLDGFLHDVQHLDNGNLCVDSLVRFMSLFGLLCVLARLARRKPARYLR